MTDEGLVALFSEVKDILNSRPLTPVSFVEDLERSLAPKDMLLISTDSELLPTNIDNSDIVFRNRWRHVQAHADLFWKRWAKEYSPVMNQRQKWLRTYFCDVLFHVSHDSFTWFRTCVTLL